MMVYVRGGEPMTCMPDVARRRFLETSVSPENGSAKLIKFCHIWA